MKIAELMQKKSELEKALAEHGETALKEEFKGFFEVHPEAVGIRWMQYTPYFNDGETCEFGVHEFYVKMSDSEPEAGDYGDGFEDGWRQDNRPALVAAIKAASELQRVGDEVYRIAFGDHVRVTATREGFEVEGYDHD